MRQFSAPLITLLVLSLAGPMAGCDATTRLTEQEHIQRAKDFEDEGDLKSSIVELKNAIQKNPNSAQARLLLGQVYLKAGLGEEAEKELLRAHELGVNRESIKTALGEALMLMGEYERVLDEIQPDTQTSKGNLARIYQIRADALLKQGQVRDACNLFQQSHEIDKLNVPTYWGLAQCAVAKRNLDEARELLDKALALKNRQAKTWIYIGDWERLKQDNQAALEAYGNALKSDPKNLDALHSRAALNLAAGKHEAAKSDIDQVVKLAPKSLSALYLQALFDFERRNYAQAREGLQEIFKITEDYGPGILLAGATDYALGSYQQAAAQLTRYLNRSPDHLYTRKLLAATLIQQKAAEQALEVLSPLLATDTKDVSALVLAAEAFRLKRDHVKAAEYLAKASEIDPRNATIQTQLGYSHLAAGNTELGITELSKAAYSEQDSNRATSLLVAALLNKREFDKALAILSKLEEKLGNNPGYHVLKGNALLGKNDITVARKSFERALTLDPGHYPAAAALARLDLADKKPEMAQKRFERILSTEKNNLQAMLALAELASSQKREEAFVDWLKKASETHPEAIAPRKAMVQHLLSKKENQKALVAAKEVVNLDPDNPAAQELLGSVMLAMGDLDGAISTYAKITRLASQSPDAYTKLARVQVRANKLKDARNSLDTALKLQPDHQPSLDILIGLEMKAGKPDQALKLARQIQSSHPDSPLGFEREGDILLSQKNPPAATKAYDQALAKNAGSVLFIKSHRAHAMTGGPMAEEKLRNWLLRHPKDGIVRFYAAEYYSSIGRQRDAIAAYELLVSQVPGHTSALNNLAGLYQSMGDKRALPTAERALKTSPDNPAVLDTLGWILVEQGQIDRGLELIEGSLAQLPDNATIRYHRAIALMRKGDKARARRELELLLKDAPRFPQAEAAESALRKL